ncbi:hypothetical protein SAMN04487948_10981 [Halogranum amylolyticum]|uniref:Uncharacterized protein n=1 Tax=Halogranum amylolyticum TaxID=660520 RepID=A0A1H8U1T8_9EURY|nr:hypothetical protein [Halogranum amylolyticum]SEO97240.1 hypothetical protein SAMN04487948_10981 [Halogranum amylolyticum]
MRTTVRRRLDRYRQPEYTGENRCTPCTVVNLAIAVVLSVAVGVSFTPLGVVVAGVSLLAIYLRGYLVPGTPTLTKRYLPEQVLQWFDKRPTVALDADLDVEAQLLAVDAVEPADDDLRITDEFETAWDEEITRVRGDLERRVGSLLELDDPAVERGTDVCRVFDGDRLVARWPSTAALVADVAAIPLLRDRASNWDDLSRAEQGQLLSGLRLFVERCPDCGGELLFSEDHVESCCRTVDVVTYDCDACAARVMEIER